MIIGIGSDLVDIRRIERLLERHGERFVTRVYSVTERERADRSGQKAAVLAKRFAAKEACAKALGTGMNRGVFFRDIAVVNQSSGAPKLELSGGAAARLAALVPVGETAILHLSLSDDYPMAQAFVVIEGRKS